MSIRFSADEIFEMAEEIERNGGKFYRKAAEGAADNDIRRYLLDMAAMEDGHLHTFAEMREHLSDAEREVVTFDPENEAALYLDAMADSHGTEGKKSVTKCRRPEVRVVVPCLLCFARAALPCTEGDRGEYLLKPAL